MKNVLALFCACMAIASLIAVAKANRSDNLRTRITRLFPHADTNGDGVISDAEEAAPGTQAPTRYADADGDGALSTKEKHVLFNMGAQKFHRNQSDGSSSALAEVNRSEEAENITAPPEAPLRRGPQAIKPGEYGIGIQIPPLSFTDITGRTHSLLDFAERKAIVFAMTGTGCPLCLKYATTLASIEQQYRSRGVEFIFVNPNQSEQLQEIGDAVEAHGFRGPYIQDANRDLTIAMKASTTTEVFVLDRARTLVYRGAVDDQYGFGYALQSPRRAFLVDALDAVLEGRTPAIQATTSPGCELSCQSVGAAVTSITYHNRISRIIQANCLDCHRSGGTAPMAFERYEAVKDYAGMIADVVERRIMPPWFAAPVADQQHDGPDSLHWANDRSLSAAEKDDLISWINAGVPEGEPADKPLTKHFPDGWLIGKPDATFRLSEPIQVKATGTMPYQYNTVDTALLEDKWVKAIEIRPSDLDVVHHVIVSIKSESRGDEKINEFWAGYAPGNSTWIYPDGYARRLPKGARLRFQMHYTPNGRATEDQTQIGLVFSDEPPLHEVKVAPIANRNLRIPAGAANHEVVANLRLPYDVKILSFLPHMHLRGKAARYEVVSGNHQRTLLDVPHYDFNWQLLYRLAHPLPLQRGDTIRFTGWFDNSTGNPANPDPTAVVRWGEQTEDEMHVGYLEYVATGATPGEPVAAMRSERSKSPSHGLSASGRETATVKIAGRAVPRKAIVNALRTLDSDHDGRVLQSQVAKKHIQLFNALDTNDDGVVTDKEVKEALR